jgi:hypothetical protein
MRDGLFRIFAIVRADFLIRFRKISTAIIFLLLCIAAYLWIPDPSTGRALLQIKEQRALYNSAALGMATASLCSILLGLMGYYMVSSSIQSDIRARTGFVIASTNIKNYEYLLGKFLGNFIFLSTVVIGFMISSMVMQLLRGEAPLQPLVFGFHYLLIVPPILVFASVIAILFESIRFLSGRFGDAVYFFLWMFTFLIAVQINSNAAGPNWAACLDMTGLGFIMNQLQPITGKAGMAIGSSEFDVSKPPFIFHGLTLTREWILPRLGSLFFPIPLLLLALLLFHRFDPVRLKASSRRTRRSWLGFFNEKLKFVTTLIPLMGGSRSGAKSSFAGSVLQDALLTLRLYPVIALILIGLIIVSVFSSVHRVQTAILPVIFAVVIIAVSDIASREKRIGLLTTVFAMPALKSNYAFWKFGASLLLILTFTLVPILKLAFTDGSATFSLLIGCFFTAAVATCLGLLSSNPKTFIILFGMFWYVVLNDGGQNPSFDFAGWYGTATVRVQMAYLGITVTVLALTQTLNAILLKRNY